MNGENVAKIGWHYTVLLVLGGKQITVSLPGRGKDQ
jgi:hypothetical protein